MENIDETENEARLLRGELYHAFMPKLAAKRNRCHQATNRFNLAGDVSRRRLVELFREITLDDSALPLPGATEEADAILLADEPYIDGPIKIDYGTNLRFGRGVYINFNYSLGAGTLVGTSCAFYSASHPLDPFLRNGIKGPDLGKPIVVGEDCWFGGNVTVLPGVTIGRGVTVGAGSVVTEYIPDFHCVAGNPARIIKKIEVYEPDLAS